MPWIRNTDFKQVQYMDISEFKTSLISEKKLFSWSFPHKLGPLIMFLVLTPPRPPARCRSTPRTRTCRRPTCRRRASRPAPPRPPSTASYRAGPTTSAWKRCPRAASRTRLRRSTARSHCGRTMSPLIRRQLGRITLRSGGAVPTAYRSSIATRWRFF